MACLQFVGIANDNNLEILQPVDSEWQKKIEELVEQMPKKSGAFKLFFSGGEWYCFGYCADGTMYKGVAPPVVRLLISRILGKPV